MAKPQKPLLLKDFLKLDPYSDSPNSFISFPRKTPPQTPTVRFLIEAERRRSSFTKFINAVKNFPHSSPTRPKPKARLNEEYLLIRSITRKLNKRFWKRKEKEERRVTTVNDIVRLDSCELNGDRSLCFPSPVVSSCSSCSDGEEGSESFVSSSSSGGSGCFDCEKLQKSASRSRSQSGQLSLLSKEGENQDVECQPEEEKEQLSPVTVMDFPYPDEEEEDEDEEDEASSSGFEQNLANIERTTLELLQKIRRFETLAELLDPLDLDLRFSSSDDEQDLKEASPYDITAKHLIQRLRCNHKMDPLSEKLLVDFFSEALSCSKGTTSADTGRLLLIADNWINGEGCLKAKEQGKAQLSEMERNARWRGFEDGMDDVAADLEGRVLGSLLHELVLDITDRN